MNPSLVAELLEEKSPTLRILYGVATGANTVLVAGSTVAVVLPALSPVVSGDYVAVLATGADRLILGRVGGSLGVVGYAERTTNQGGITALADLTGLSVTWTAVTSRRYRLSFSGQAVNSTGSTMCDYVIATSANVQVVLRSHFMVSGGITPNGVGAEVYLTGLSGSVTYKVRASSPSGALQISASATSPAFFTVEDIGPA